MVPEVATIENEFTDVELCTCNYDMSKAWFVYFDYTDHTLGISVRKQFRGGINYYHDKEERIRYGNALKNVYQKRLESGWNPITDSFRKKDKATNQLVTLADTVPAMIKVKPLKQSSATAYSYIANTFIKWCERKKYDRMAPRNFTDQMAQAYLDYLISDRDVEPKTYNNHLTCLRGLFTCMLKPRYIIQVNPFAELKMFKNGVTKNLAYTEEEQQLLQTELYANYRGLYYYTAWMYYLLIRRTELCNIKIEYINFKEGTVFIPEEISKNKSAGSVVIPDVMLPIIREMNLDKMPGDWYVFGHGLVPGPKKYKRPSNVTELHKAISRRLGIAENKSLYSWKHTGVVAAYKATKDIYAIMRQCRHKKISVTEIYLQSLGLVENTAIRQAKY